MKKFVVMLAVVCILLGLRLWDNGLLGCGYKGTFTVYGKDGSETVYAEDRLPLLDRFDAYATRMDIIGGETEALTVLKNLNAQVKWHETFDGGLTVVYGYSPDIFRYKTVKDTRINVMIAYGAGDTVAIGCPLLMGSY